MSDKFKCDIGVFVTAETAEQAAEICAAVLAIGAQITASFVPCFVGVQAPEGDQVQTPTAPEMARGIFDGIMGDSAV